MASCQHCGTEFSKNCNVQKFCSPECLKAARKPRCGPVREVACKGCSVKFETTDVRKTFCTDSCRHTWANRQRPTSKTEFRDCVVCSKAFQPMQKTGPGRKWCSEACKHVMNGNPKRLERHLGKATVTQEQAEAVRQSRRNRSLQQYFGISLADYDAMHEKQDGLCAICHRPETVKNNYDSGVRRLAVDHCHTTGKIRSLLCGKCNAGIGHFEDNTALLQAAIEYLKAHSQE